MNETIDALTEDAKKHLKEAGEYQAKADRATLAAGVALRELKARITNKESAEGEEWDRSWSKFVKAELQGECSYSHAQRLIGFANSEDPQAAVAEYREQDAAKKRERRASQTSENEAKAPDDAPRKSATGVDVPQRQPSSNTTGHAAGPARHEPSSAKRVASPLDGAEIEMPVPVTEFAASDVYIQAGILINFWREALPEARKLFCEEVGLRQIPPAREAA